MRRPTEVSEIHTRLLRLSLAVEACRAYWEHADPALPPDRAFEQRWFGAKSMPRVKLIVANMAVRFDAYPDALAVLRQWRGMDRPTRTVICHFHLQLADPLYRRFTGLYLPERRTLGAGEIDRSRTAAWVRDEGGGRWAPSTINKFASALLTSAKEAGLVAGGQDTRRLLLPDVPDAALAYLLQLLRGTAFDGQLLANPYLRSVGLSGEVLDRRLSRLRGLTYHRLGDVTDLEWVAPDLRSWAATEATP